MFFLPKMAKKVAKMAENDSILFIIEKHRGLIIILTATITNFDCPGSTQTLYISKKWMVGIILIIITGGREVNFLNPPITGMRICDKSWEFFAKNSQKLAKMAKN